MELYLEDDICPFLWTVPQYFLTFDGSRLILLNRSSNIPGMFSVFLLLSILPPVGRVIMFRTSHPKIFQAIYPFKLNRVNDNPNKFNPISLIWTITCMFQIAYVKPVIISSVSVKYIILNCYRM